MLPGAWTSDAKAVRRNPIMGGLGHEKDPGQLLFVDCRFGRSCCTGFGAADNK
jgi:hypothetical protein